MMARSDAYPPAEGQRVHITQGGHCVTGDPDTVFTTTLGSCVAACLCDPTARVGGMNHFLLPDAPHGEGAEARKYGAYAMELLVNGLLRAGAQKRRLVAKLFGGARLSPRLVDVGAKNVAFAEAFLRREGIQIWPGSVRGVQARRIQFWPATGRVRALALVKHEASLVETERPAPLGEFGVVELF